MDQVKRPVTGTLTFCSYMLCKRNVSASPCNGYQQLRLRKAVSGSGSDAPLRYTKIHSYTV